ALLREIEQMGYLFPDFGDEVDEALRNQFKHYKKVPGGYTIASDAGLRQVLTNRAYIGYWVYMKEVVNTDNHEAIVDRNDFLYAFNRLSMIQLDGSPNEEALQHKRKFAGKYDFRNAGLLK